MKRKVIMDLIDRFVSNITRKDFRIADMDDGVERGHSVKFAPSSGAAGNTPTPTHTYKQAGANNHALALAHRRVEQRLAGRADLRRYA